MSNNPINLALRFMLELAMLAALAYWGWTMHEGLTQVLLVIALPLAAATLWGVFRVDNDPKKAPVRIPGVLRLLLELALFVMAVALLAQAGQPTLALIFDVIVLIHYVISYDRIQWLLQQP